MESTDLRIGDVVEALVDGGAKVDKCLVLFMLPTGTSVRVVRGDRIGESLQHDCSINITFNQIMRRVGSININ